MNKLIYPIFTILLLSGCNAIKTDGLWSPSTEYSINYIFVDVTDDNNRQEILNDEHIEQLVKSVGWNVGGNIHNGALFRIFTLSDLGQTKSIDLEIKMAETGLNGQPALARKRDIDNFVKKTLKLEIKKYISSLNTAKKSESEIFSNLCRQLKILVELKADRKNVVIYSDMLENGSEFSMYKKQGINIDSFKKAGINCTFPEIKDINIHIVPPISNENERLVANAERLWSDYFAFKNAKSFKFDINLILEQK